MPVRLPRTIRLDPSDTFVFEPAAQPGEWAVSGASLLSGEDLASLTPKQRAALRSGFLGIASFGWSTLVVVSEASDTERADAVAQSLDGEPLIIPAVSGDVYRALSAREWAGFQKR